MVKILPTPKSCEMLEGCLTLPANLSVLDKTFSPLADAFATAFEKMYELPLSRKEGGITLEMDPTLPAGHYVCDFSERMRLLASDVDGMRSAVATALQIIEIKDAALACDRLVIRDYPDKDYRALMVDLSRCWHPFHTLLRYVDVCWILKLKYLHLHFIDDPSYTLPSRAFPKLPTPGRHYTEEQIAELNAYAKARGIILIPEIEGDRKSTRLNSSHA